MAEAVKMPKMSDTMTEGVLAKWHKKVGDPVKTGELVAEIETDKATMDFESFQEGTLLYIGPKEGEAVPVDGLIAILGKPGEDFSGILSSNGNAGTRVQNAANAEKPVETIVAEAPKEMEHARENGHGQIEMGRSKQAFG